MFHFCTHSTAARCDYGGHASGSCLQHWHSRNRARASAMAGDGAKSGTRRKGGQGVGQKRKKPDDDDGSAHAAKKQSTEASNGKSRDTGAPAYVHEEDTISSPSSVEDDEAASGEGTTRSNPNPVVVGPRRSIFGWTPGERQRAWYVMLSDYALEHNLWSVLPFVDDTSAEQSHDNRTAKYTAPYRRGRTSRQYLPSKVRTPPLMVTGGVMAGVGAVKCQKNETYEEREYYVYLSPLVSTSMYAPDCKVYVPAHTEPVEDCEQWPETPFDEQHKGKLPRGLEIMQEHALDFFDRLVRLHLFILKTMYEDTNFKPHVKSYQRSLVMQELEATQVVGKDGTRQYVSTHEQYDKLSSLELAELIETKCLEKWYAEAKTPFSRKDDDASSNLASHGKPAEDPTPFMYRNPETGEMEEYVPEETEEDVPWYKMTKQAHGTHYGGKFPRLSAKRNAMMGKTSNLKFTPKRDFPGQAKWYEAQRRFAENSNLFPEEFGSEMYTNPALGQNFTKSMRYLTDYVFKYDTNFVPNTYVDPYGRPLHEIGNRSLLYAELCGGPVSKGSICSFNLKHTRSCYPDNQPDNYGTSIGVDPYIVVYAGTMLTRETMAVFMQPKERRVMKECTATNALYLTTPLDYSEAQKPIAEKIAAFS